MIIFLKAILPRAGTADLFAAPVQVSGYVNAEGTFVAPHRSVRHKRRDEAQHDLFFSPPAALVRQKPAAKPKPAPVQAEPDLFAEPAPAAAVEIPTEAPVAPKAPAEEWTTEMPAELRTLYAERQKARVAWEEATAEQRIYGRPVPKDSAEKTALDAVNTKVAAEEIATRWCKPSTAESIRALYGVPAGYPIDETYKAGADRPRDITLPGDKEKLAIRWHEGAPRFDHLGWNYGQGFSGGYWQVPWKGARNMSLAALPGYLEKLTARRVEPAPPPADETPAPPPAWPSGLSLVEHVTGKGKTLRGVIRTDLTGDQAKQIDEYTFRKNGGWFVRERHVPAEVLAPVDAGAAAEPTASPAPEPPAATVVATKPSTSAASIAADMERAVAKRTAQAAKMREAANKLAESAQEDMNRDRQANTARRARMAAGATENAARQLRTAETMHNLADAIDRGEAVHLSGVSTRAAVEQLDSTLRQAKYTAVRARNDGSLPQRELDEPIRAEDIRYATMPRVWVSVGTARELADEIEKAAPRGHAKAIRWLRDWASAGKDTTVYPDQEMEEKLRDALGAVRKKAGARRTYSAAERLEESIRDTDRMRRIGITSDVGLQQALVEYVQYRGGTKSEDPIKRLERELVGQKGIGIDFFPTPKDLVQRLVDEADIRPGMKVLEPSAGKGDISDAARAAGGDVDSVELSPTLRAILEAKGHKLAGSDFMEHEAPEGGYDRVVMNPPFSDRMDAAHVMRAYDMLKPGGRLVAVTGEGVHFGSDAKARQFRDWLQERGATAEKLPEGSFKSAFRPTGVNTRLVILDKPADAPAVNPGPKEGDTKVENGVTYTLRDGRWHAPEPTASAPESFGMLRVSPEHTEAVVGRLRADGAKDLSDAELDRVLSMTVGGQSLVEMARHLRDTGLITPDMIAAPDVVAPEPAAPAALAPGVGSLVEWEDDYGGKRTGVVRGVSPAGNLSIIGAPTMAANAIASARQILEAGSDTLAKALADGDWRVASIEAAAARLAAEEDGSFSEADLARHWSGGDADLALHHLHARTGDFMPLPSGRWSLA